MARLNIPVFVALAASLLAAIDARNTLPHQRMIRKRAPLGHVEERAAAFVVPRWPGLKERQQPDTSSAAAPSTRSVSSAGSASASASATKVSSTSAATTSSVATSSSASSAAETSSASASTSSGLLDTLTGILGGTQSSTTVSSTSSTPSSTVPTSTSILTSSAAPPSSSQAAAPTTSSTPTLNIATPPPPTSARATPSTVVLTSIAPEVQASQAAEQKARTAKITKNTIISLVVVASCIGGAVAIWTVIRKWKLSPSERFDDRMQPIDWAPTGGVAGMHEETIEEKRHRRAGSAGSHGSFTSGGVGQSEAGHGARSVYSEHAGAQAPAQDFPPPHDFTAGTANYGQYYQGQQQYAAGAGYADLQRGPSVSESNYSHGASVTRGLSYSRGGAGYDAQPGAGGVPPLPNPYGGGYEYEDYGRQAGQGQGRGY